MNTPAKWDPLRDLNELSHRLGSVFGQAPVRSTDPGHEHLKVADWAPLVDITEDDKEFCIKAELPEVDKKDVKVSVEDGVLTITGERHKEVEDKGKKYHRVERSHGSFARSFTLPEGVDDTKVTAGYTDGVLMVHLPKCAAPKPRAMDVKIA